MLSRNNLVLIFLVLAKFLVQYLAIDSGYELHRDEYLHLDLGKHLAWGYRSVPPITGFLSYLIHLLGNDVFWVKFFPAAFGAITLWIVWKATEALKGGLFAMVLASSCVFFSALLRINTLYQPNSLEFMLWTLVFYTVLQFVRTENNKWIWIGALAFAIGFLNKYNIGFLAMGLFLALLVSPQRKIFSNRQLYGALALVLILITPNLHWQYTQNFPVIRHLNELARTQLVYVNRMDFLKEQFLFFVGGLPVLFLALFSFFTHPPFRKYRLFFWNLCFTLLLFTYFKAKSYYAMGLYPILFAFGAVYAESLLSGNWKRYLRPVLLAIPLLVIIVMFRIMVPVLSPPEIVEKSETFEKFGLLRWEDGRNHQIPQDFADMLGWSELAGLVDQALEKVTDKEHTLIHCDNYGEAGAINYYSKRLFRDAVSTNADYIDWYPLDAFEIRDVILVKSTYDDDPEREREREFFESVELIGQINNPYAREFGTRVWLLKGAKVSINDILREEIQREKAE